MVHLHDGGHLARQAVDYDYVEHYADDEPGLLVVRGVPAQVCASCDEFWFDDEVGFALAHVIEDHRPPPGRVVTIDWLDTQAA